MKTRFYGVYQLSLISQYEVEKMSQRLYFFQLFPDFSYFSTFSYDNVRFNITNEIVRIISLDRISTSTIITVFTTQKFVSAAPGRFAVTLALQALKCNAGYGLSYSYGRPVWYKDCANSNYTIYGVVDIECVVCTQNTYQPYVNGTTKCSFCPTGNVYNLVTGSNFCLFT